MIVNISKDPNTGVARQVLNNRVVIDEEDRFVLLICYVLRIKNNKEVAPREEVRLIATDQRIVNEAGDVLKDEDGNPLPPDGQHMTEFEYYMHVAENVDIRLNNLRRAAISKADDSQRFNTY